jgi:hypothetical protein
MSISVAASTTTLRVLTPPKGARNTTPPAAATAEGLSGTNSKVQQADFSRRSSPAPSEASSVPSPGIRPKQPKGRRLSSGEVTPVQATIGNGRRRSNGDVTLDGSVLTKEERMEAKRERQERREKEKQEKREKRAAQDLLGEATNAAAEAFTSGLCWSLNELPLLQQIELSKLRLSCKQVKVDAHLRTLCHGSKDGLTLTDRLASRQVIIVLGDFTRASVPWVALVQAAIRLNLAGFNIVWMDIPSFNLDKTSYMKHGPGLLLNLIEQLQLRGPNVLATGVGGAVFLRAMTADPDAFGATHLVHSMSFPEVKGAGFDDAQFGESILYQTAQVWLSYQDLAPVANQASDRSATVHGQLAQWQKRLQQGRKTFDEILISEGLGSSHVSSLSVSEHSVFMFSDQFLGSMERYFSNAPNSRQGSLPGGLTGDRKKLLNTSGNNTSGVSSQYVDTIIANVSRRREKYMMDGPTRKQMQEDYRKMRLDVRDLGSYKKEPVSPTLSKQSTQESDSLGKASVKSSSPTLVEKDKLLQELSKSKSSPSLFGGTPERSSSDGSVNGRRASLTRSISGLINAMTDLVSRGGGRSSAKVGRPPGLAFAERAWEE